MTTEEMFERAAAQLLAGRGNVERGRMFGSDAIKSGGKVFAL